MAKNTRYTGIKKVRKGIFHVRVSTTDPRTGKRKEKKDTITGTIEDALAMREQFRALLTGRSAEQPKTTRQRLAEFAKSWMQRKMHDLSPATVDRYGTTLDRHILADLGEYYFDMLDRDDVQAWVNKNLANGYKVTTVKSWFRILATMTRDAVAELRLVSDPTLRIRFPEEEEGAKSEAITPEELERFLTAMRKEFPQHFALVIVMAYTGLRFCHASALEWPDWDERTKVLHIRRSQVRGKIGRVRRKKSAPKVIPLLPVVVDALRWHRDRMRELQAPGLSEGWMFPSRVGTLRATSSLDKAFKRCCKIAGITARFTPHGMRYTLTDTLRFAKIDPIVRRELIGHRTEKMQANYSTVRVEEHREALRRAAELLSKEPFVYSAVYPEADEEDEE